MPGKVGDAAKRRLDALKRQVESLSSDNEELRAQLLVREHDLSEARNKLRKAQDEVSIKESAVETLTLTVRLLNETVKACTAEQVTRQELAVRRVRPVDAGLDPAD